MLLVPWSDDLEVVHHRHVLVFEVAALAQATRDSGLPVNITIEGESGRIPAVVDATAYRIS